MVPPVFFSPKNPHDTSSFDYEKYEVNITNCKLLGKVNSRLDLSTSLLHTAHLVSFEKDLAQ